MHVHFAAHASVETLRVGAMLGVPVSITAHAYDIFLSPTALPEKLHAAAFTTTGCAYNAAHLRAPRGASEPTCTRSSWASTPSASAAAPRTQDGRTVVAVGRLTEKKGCAHLIETRRPGPRRTTRPAAHRR